ncbi:hypothetical protein NEFER03_2034 [Nematocida sp. LUAm3]|nr:hypothetical protein NEFER03_2034 [Nematocida sp. LUAm3]KAI5174508.1 hypothetical protein NEFER02_0629 [Nematocida sp. LUAm2]KAI5179159.1 hypothetical protein NEFER01_2022 [Nematocida sp. LUAm1]
MIKGKWSNLVFLLGIYEAVGRGIPIDVKKDKSPSKDWKALKEPVSDILGDDVPREGYLYNAGSHSYVAMPSYNSPFFLKSLVKMNRNKKYRLLVNLETRDQRKSIYTILLNTEPNPLLKNVYSPRQALTFRSFLLPVLKNVVRPKDPRQTFVLSVSEKYPEFFRIKYKNKCVTYIRTRHLIFKACLDDKHPVVGNQLFKIETDEVDKSVTINPISEQYFSDLAPISRYAPDMMNGQFIFINDKHCQFEHNHDIPCDDEEEEKQRIRNAPANPDASKDAHLVVNPDGSVTNKNASQQTAPGADTLARLGMPNSNSSAAQGQPRAGGQTTNISAGPNKRMGAGDAPPPADPYNDGLREGKKGKMSRFFDMAKSAVKKGMPLAKKLAPVAGSAAAQTEKGKRLTSKVPGGMDTINKAGNALA